MLTRRRLGRQVARRRRGDALTKASQPHFPIFPFSIFPQDNFCGNDGQWVCGRWGRIPVPAKGPSRVCRAEALSSLIQGPTP